MSDENERSVASAGSVAGEPAAWGVMRVGGSWVSILANEVQAETSRKSFDKMESWVHEIVPLYRQPQPTLTDAEREAIERARRLIASTMPYESQQGAEDYQALSGLLERMK